jgi:hypothetical protein
MFAKYMDSTNILLILAVSSVFGTVAITCVRYCSKSRCREISLCCGLVDVVRDTENEERRYEFDVNNGVNNNGGNSGSLDNNNGIRPSFFGSVFKV